MAPTLGPSIPPPPLPPPPPSDGGLASPASSTASMASTSIMPTIATPMPAAVAATMTATTTTANDDYNRTNTNHHHQQQQRRRNPTIEYTRVDGKGLWRSWKRNFKDKLLAVLDLIDNSLDAAMMANRRRNDIREGGEEDDDDDVAIDNDFVGRVHIYPDDVTPTSSSSSSSSSLAVVPDAAPSDSTSTKIANAASTSPPAPPPPPPSGLCIVNNSCRPIRPLKEVLEIYSSSKTDSGARDIGENGVGLKQGCATLSDLSFVLVYNDSEGKYVELGIIAESLQMAEGCYLPAFSFAISEDDDDHIIESLYDQMKDLFSRTEHVYVAKCIERYGSDIAVSAGGGGGLPRRRDDDDLLGRGIDRLCRHIEGMMNFFDNKHVFAVILDRVSYGKTNDQSRQALDAIRDLRSVIPRTYLHVPAGFDFRIGNSSMNRKRTVFHYWPQRLVEMSSFHVSVHENLPWYSQPYHINYDATSYKLRVFVGFDRVRINSPEEAKSASLYVYSRHSGRLIKQEQDARHILGLTAGGTMFCSGLTVLVDDIDGKLPLNPTKQDVAFAEQANGDVHKGNLFAWVGAVASFFYNYHLAKFNNKKAVLTDKIKCYGSEPTRVAMKDIDRSELTTFTYHHTYYRNKYIRIVKASAREIIGIDTHFKLVCDKHPVNVPSSVTYDEPASRKRKVDHILGGSGDHAGSSTMNQNAMTYPPREHMQQFFGQHAPQFDRGRGLESGTGNDNMTGSVAGVGGAYHNQSGAPLLGTGSHMQFPTVGMINYHPDRQQLQHFRNEDAPPPLSRSTNTEEPIPIQTTKFPASSTTSTNHNVSTVVSRRSEDGANATMADTADDNDDDDSVSSTKSYYKDLCEKLTAELEKRNAIDHATKIKTKRLKRDLVELKDELKRQQDLVADLSQRYSRLIDDNM